MALRTRQIGVATLERVFRTGMHHYVEGRRCKRGLPVALVTVDDRSGERGGTGMRILVAGRTLVKGRLLPPTPMRGIVATRATDFRVGAPQREARASMLETIFRNVTEIGGDVTTRTTRTEAPHVRILVTGTALIEGDRGEMQTALRRFGTAEKPVLVTGDAFERRVLASQRVSGFCVIKVRNVVPFVHSMTTRAVASEPLGVLGRMTTLTG